MKHFIKACVLPPPWAREISSSPWPTDIQANLNQKVEDSESHLDFGFYILPFPPTYTKGRNQATWRNDQLQLELGQKYSQLWVSVGFTSTDSTNYGLEVFEKIPGSSTKQNLNLPCTEHDTEPM